jgi:hypothetical protein
VIKILSEFQGIIGATVGVIATLIVTSIIKKLGKTYIYFRDWEIKFYKMDGAGGFISSEFEEAISCSYSFEMEIFNSSELPKALRGIKVRFYNSDNNFLTESIPKDESTRKVSTGRSIIEAIKIINLPPKQMIHFNVSGYIKKEDLKNLNKWRKVYFESFDNRGRKIKRIIHEKQ